jgi:hypothetical protein
MVSESGEHVVFGSAHGRDGAKPVEWALTRDTELDLLANRQAPQKLAGLESKWLVAILAQTGRGDVCKRERPLSRRIVGADEDKGVSAQHRLDVGKE